MAGEATPKSFASIVKTKMKNEHKEGEEKGVYIQVW